MGYHVTILRTEGTTKIPIRESELTSQPIVGLGWSFDGSSDPKRLLFNGPDTYVLFFSDEELWTKNPDESMLKRMVALASAIGARVRGDELESYKSDLSSYTHPDDAPLKEPTEISRTRIFWHRHGSRLLLVAFFIVAYAIMKLFGTPD